MTTRKTGGHTSYLAGTFTVRTLRIVKVDLLAAKRTHLLRQAIIFSATRLKQFDLSTGRTAIEIHFHSACHEIAPIPRKPPRFTELDFLTSRIAHPLPAAQAVQFPFHFRTSKLFYQHNTEVLRLQFAAKYVTLFSNKMQRRSP